MRLVVLSFLLVAACRGSPAPEPERAPSAEPLTKRRLTHGACDYIAEQSYCTDHGPEELTEEKIAALDEICVSGGGKPLPGGCPKTNRIGRCGNDMGVRYHYYAAGGQPMSAASAKDNCVSMWSMRWLGE